jgi:hypothetical protein
VSVRNRHIGCGLWLLWLFLALFAAEWLGLWLVIQALPGERLPQAVLLVAGVTMVVGWVAVFVRLQWRKQ